MLTPTDWLIGVFNMSDQKRCWNVSFQHRVEKEELVLSRKTHDDHPVFVIVLRFICMFGGVVTITPYTVSGYEIHCYDEPIFSKTRFGCGDFETDIAEINRWFELTEEGIGFSVGGDELCLEQKDQDNPLVINDDEQPPPVPFVCVDCKNILPDEGNYNECYHCCGNNDIRPFRYHTTCNVPEDSCFCGREYEKNNYVGRTHPNWDDFILE